MKPDPTYATRQSLLERLRHWSDQQSWQEFFNHYWRLIYSTARQAGLSDAEAQDTVQETVLVVAQQIKSFTYDPSRASFRTWLLRVARWSILRQIRQRDRPRHAQAASPEFPAAAELEQLPDPAGINLEQIWEEEWQKNLYTTALEEVKRKVSPGQMQIFNLYVTQERSVSDICRTLRISAARVYLAKHRISRLIEKEVRRLEKGDYW